MAVRHRQAGVREPGVVGVHGRAVSQALAGGGVVFLKEDFLEAVTAEPESRRHGELLDKDKESVRAEGKECGAGGLVLVEKDVAQNRWKRSPEQSREQGQRPQRHAA